MIDLNDIFSWSRIVKESESMHDRAIAAAAMLGGFLAVHDTHNAAETIMATHRKLLQREDSEAAWEWLHSSFVSATLSSLSQRHEFFAAWLNQLNIDQHAHPFEAFRAASRPTANSEALNEETGFSPWADCAEAAHLSADAFRERVRESVPSHWLETFSDKIDSSTTLGVHSLLAMSESRSPETSLKHSAATFKIQGAWELDLKPDDILRAIMDRRIIIRRVTLGVQE